SYWENSEGNAAANGGIMRTSVLGIWEYLESDRLIENVEKVCKITHFDPRCVGSSVAVSLVISYLLQGVTDLPKLITEIEEKVAHYHPSISEYFALCKHSNIEELHLGDKHNMGYTLKTMAAGFWALQYAKSYEDGILKIIHQGGDADTNAAVAGGILGAKFGYNNIPQKWIEELAYRAQLTAKVTEFIELLNQ
ncbi:MAG TPA: ADP-ribosylglycohydrolase family protein, partial [Allocoleopsis sp.]